MQKEKSLAESVVGALELAEADGISDILSLTYFMIEAPKLATLLVDWSLNSDISVLFSHNTESSNQISDVGEPLNKAWLVVALLRRGMTDLAETGVTRSKNTTYWSKSPPPQLVVFKQKLAASEDCFKKLLVMFSVSNDGTVSFLTSDPPLLH